jgi:hypothetical protein
VSRRIQGFSRSLKFRLECSHPQRRLSVHRLRHDTAPREPSLSQRFQMARWSLMRHFCPMVPQARIWCSAVNGRYCRLRVGLNDMAPSGGRGPNARPWRYPPAAVTAVSGRRRSRQGRMTISGSVRQIAKQTKKIGQSYEKFLSKCGKSKALLTGDVPCCSTVVVPPEFGEINPQRRRRGLAFS